MSLRLQAEGMEEAEDPQFQPPPAKPRRPLGSVGDDDFGYQVDEEGVRWGPRPAARTLATTAWHGIQDNVASWTAEDPMSRWRLTRVAVSMALWPWLTHGCNAQAQTYFTLEPR